MRKLLLSVLFLAFAYVANAQFEIGGTIGCAIPIGNFAERSGGGLNLQAQGKYAFTDRFKLAVEGGYNSFSAAEDWKNQKIAYGNIMAQYFLSTRDVRPYIEGGLHYSYYWDSRTTPDQGANTPGSKAGLVPVIGLEASVVPAVAIDLNVRYNAILFDIYPKFPIVFDKLNTGLDYVTIQVGIIWKIGK